MNNQLTPTELEIIEQYRALQGAKHPTAIIIWVRPSTPTTILVARPPQSGQRKFDGLGRP